MDAVHCFKQGYAESFEEFTLRNGLDKKPIIALLAGSRKQEIKDNLQRMIQASRNYTEYQFVIAGALEYLLNFIRLIWGMIPKLYLVRHIAC